MGHKFADILPAVSVPYFWFISFPSDESLLEYILHIRMISTCCQTEFSPSSHIGVVVVRWECGKSDAEFPFSLLAGNRDDTRRKGDKIWFVSFFFVLLVVADIRFFCVQFLEKETVFPLLEAERTHREDKPRRKCVWLGMNLYTLAASSVGCWRSV